MDLTSFASTQKFYSENAEAFFKETLPLDLTTSYKIFLSKLERESLILDLGCGSGRDSNYFRKLGYLVESWEPNEKLASLAEKYLEWPVKRASSFELQNKGKYNGIWASASLLHLELKNFCETLPRIESALKSGGVFYSSFKLGSKDIHKEGRFFLMMTEERLLSCIHKMTKFKILEIRRRPDHRPERSAENWLECMAIRES